MKNLQMFEEVDGLYTLSISGVPADEAKGLHDLLMQYMLGSRKEETLAEEVVRMAREQGQGKIMCIKYVREKAQMGLREAKEFCDDLERKHSLWHRSW